MTAKTAKLSWEKRIDFECLIDGYSRENSKSSSFIPKAVTDVISYYCPKMNGHTFIWQIDNMDDGDLLNGNDVLDSGAFNIGLANNFFLRLKCLHSNTEETEEMRQSRGPPRIRGGWRSRGPRRGPPRRMPLRAPGPLRGPPPGPPRSRRDDGYDDDYEAYDQDANQSNNIKNKSSKLLLSLLSFPFPSSYIGETLHVELYFHEMHMEFSSIWQYRNERYHGAPRSPRSYYDSDSDRNEHDSYYSGHSFVFDHDLNKYPLNTLTFECKINVLRVAFNNKDKSYHYIAKPLLVFNTNTMRFMWNLNAEYVIQKLTDSGTGYGLDDDKRTVFFHSDVYFDMFQFQIRRRNALNSFRIQVCGFPRDTHKMGVKFDLFAMDKDNERDKIKILSNVTTFSYKSPFYKIPPAKAEILTDLLNQYQSLSILCHATIIQKYDKFQNIIRDVVEDEYEDDIKENWNQNELSLQNNKQQTTSKFMQHASQTFLWKIDQNILNMIKAIKFNTYDSKIFELLGRKWYIAIHKACDKNHQLLVYVNSILAARTVLTCRVRVEVIELNEAQTYYELFRSDGWCEYNNSNVTTCLLVNRQSIEDLKTLTVKVTIAIINEYNQIAIKKDKDNEDIKHEDDVNNEVDMWLKDEMKLPQYAELLRENGIDDMDTVKCLQFEDLYTIGVKIGHARKMMRFIGVSNSMWRSLLTKRNCLIFVTVYCIILAVLFG